MAEKTWKKVEREIADIVGGTRNPVSGRQRGDKADICHSWLSCEVKHKKQLPEWLHDAIDQAVQSKKGDQLPVAVLHQKNQRYSESFVVIRLGDFQDWFGSDNGLKT